MTISLEYAEGAISSITADQYSRPLPLSTPAPLPPARGSANVLWSNAICRVRSVSCATYAAPTRSSEAGGARKGGSAGGSVRAARAKGREREGTSVAAVPDGAMLPQVLAETTSREDLNYSQ